jgi:preprotein translocase subunit SecE
LKAIGDHVSTEQQVQTMTGPAPEGGGSFLERTKEYIADLQGEMRRVTWPTKEQVQATTAVVIITVFAFAAYFFLIDILLGSAITKIFAIFGVGQAR